MKNRFAFVTALALALSTSAFAGHAAPKGSAATPVAEPVAEPVADAAAPAAKTGAAKKADAKAEKLDINTATEDELKALPGVGEVRAKEIVKNRPYTGKDELVKKKVLPKNVYNKIKDQIIAKQ